MYVSNFCKLFLFFNSSFSGVFPIVCCRVLSKCGQIEMTCISVAVVEHNVHSEGGVDSSKCTWVSLVCPIRSLLVIVWSRLFLGRSDDLKFSYIVFASGSNLLNNSSFPFCFVILLKWVVISWYMCVCALFVVVMAFLAALSAISFPCISM